jgi:Putative auto-transporter adhesin, head GIN domain
MRKIVFLAALGCLLALNLTVNGQEKDNDKNRIEGSGNVVTKDLTVQPFEQLEVSGVFNVRLTQGSSEAVKIEAEDNLQPLFEVRNEGSKLVVAMKKDAHFNSKKKLTVFVTFKTLKNLDLKMVGNVSCEGTLNLGDLTLDNKSVGSVDLAFSAQKLAITNKSVGSLKLSGKADNAVIKSHSVGSIRATDLLVQTMDIENEGVGSAEVNAARELRVSDSFLGKVKNVGNATVKRKVVI